MQLSIETEHPIPERVGDTLGQTLLADLCELSNYYRGRGLDSSELTDSALRFLVGLCRYRFAPPEGDVLRSRGHIMVFGGAGAGKSTTSNILSGTDAAEVNSQAGYTRHPTAVYAPKEGETWPTQLGELTRLDRPQPGSLDKDHFSIRLMDNEAVDPGFLRSFVVWDCPDLTTRDATHYASRVIEIAALADVCIYVASDERYNDELPTSFLRAVLDAGKPTIVVLTKMSEFDVDELVSLFKRQVLSGMRHADRVIEVYAIPTPLRGKVGQLWTSDFSHGDQLRRIVAEALADLPKARNSALARTIDYFADRQLALLDPLKHDVGQLLAWKELVRRGANTAVARYETEYLNVSTGDDFTQSREVLMRAFAFDGRGAYIWNALEYLRAPFRFVKSFARKFMDRHAAGDIDESRLLHSIREQLLDSLVVAVATRRASHAFWEHLHADLLTSESLPLNSVFEETRSRQMVELRIMSRQATQRIEELVSSSPFILSVLRAARLAVDVAAIFAAFYFGWQLFQGWSLWIVVLTLAAVGGVDEMMRIACHAYIRRQRESIFQKQRDNIRELIQVSHVDVLSSLPRGLGERLERLSLICARIPRTIGELSRRIAAGSSVEQSTEASP